MGCRGEERSGGRESEEDGRRRWLASFNWKRGCQVAGLEAASFSIQSEMGWRVPVAAGSLNLREETGTVGGGGSELWKMRD